MIMSNDGRDSSRTQLPSIPLNQRLFHALQENVLGQINTNEHHLAGAHFSLTPRGAQIATHELVHALEDHLALGALHEQYALVAQHARAVDVDDAAQEVLELGRAEGPAGAEDEGLDVVVMVVVMRVIAVLAMLVVMVIMVVVAVPVVGVEELRVDLELGVEVEAAQVELVSNRHLAEMHRV